MSDNGGGEKRTEIIRSVAIRFAGDSGDGMQLTGDQYATASAIAGNDLSTLPDFPAEIRAPAGSLAGVSGFQIQIASDEVYTPGDDPDVLVAMNPAALQRNYREVCDNGIIILDPDAFSRKNLERAGFEGNPLEDGTLDAWRVFEVPVTKMTQEALRDSPLSSKDTQRCKNFFALGLMFWLYSRPLDQTYKWIQGKFAKRPEFIDANTKALQAGYNYGLTTHLFQTSYEVVPARIETGRYRKISGNTATALGFIVGAQKAGLELFLGTYPITPASPILHELAKHKAFGVITVQAEDEISAAGMAIGASYSGMLGLTASSGPGIALKSEAIGLAVMLELPLLVANIQRGGPSTGLPTKTEQADLLFTLFGRNGESPVPIVAAATPGDCFWTALEAVRIATTYMTPVYFLSDGYLANGAEPWRLPDIDAIPERPVSFRTDPDGFQPYERNERGARPWVVPGTPGLEHRIGGLEKQAITGHVSYDPANHEQMVGERAAKVAAIADDYPPTEVYGAESGELVIVGWGSTYGPIRAAVEKQLAVGRSVAQVHLRHLNPLPRDLGAVMRRFQHVLVPEMNRGQLSLLLRAEFLVDAQRFSKVQGLPFKVAEIEAEIERLTSPREPAQVEARA